MPFGVLDTFPFVAQRQLQEHVPPRNIAVDLVAYPGFALISPTDQEKEDGFPTGMNDAFFHVSDWIPCHFLQTQKKTDGYQ